MVRALFICFCAGLRLLHGAQFESQSEPEAGKVLVASEKLGDPNFQQAVILILQHGGSEGTVGIVINRRSEVPLSRIFKGKTSAKDPIYIGGPVDIRLIQAMVRLPAKPEHATHAVGDVYVTGSKGLIEKSLSSHAAASKFHVYLGYAGWQAGQLESEINLGAWSVLQANPKMIFDEDPDTLWSRLNGLAHGQIARNEGTKGWRLFKSPSRLLVQGRLEDRWPSAWQRLFLFERVPRPASAASGSLGSASPRQGLLS